MRVFELKVTVFNEVPDKPDLTEAVTRRSVSPYYRRNSIDSKKFFLSMEKEKERPVNSRQRARRVHHKRSISGRRGNLAVVQRQKLSLKNRAHVSVGRRRRNFMRRLSSEIFFRHYSNVITFVCAPR